MLQDREGGAGGNRKKGQSVYKTATERQPKKETMINIYKLTKRKYTNMHTNKETDRQTYKRTHTVINIFQIKATDGWAPGQTKLSNSCNLEFTSMGKFKINEMYGSNSRPKPGL